MTSSKANRPSLALLDVDGRCLDARITTILGQLRTRLLRKFPRLADDAVVVNVLERAGQRIAAKERRVGKIENLHAYAWVAVRSIAISELRRGAARIEQLTLTSESADDALASVPSVEGSAEHIEQTVLWRELLKMLSPEERLVCHWKAAGFSSQEIAQLQGRSAAAVDALWSRVKQRLRRALGDDVGSTAATLRGSANRDKQQD